MVATVTILMRDGEKWRQFLVVRDESVAIVDMVPALLGGWKLGRVTRQGSDDWPRMSRTAIVTWKLETDDGRTKLEPEISPEFRAKLLAHAEASTCHA